jgi:hypothetical protein
VAINVATELKSNPWAWVAVAILTTAGIAVGFASERLLRVGRGGGAAVNRGTVVSVSGARSKVKVNVMGPSAVVVVGVVTIVAVVVGLLVGRAGSRSAGEPASTSPVGPTSSTVAGADALDVRIEHLRAFSEGWFVVFPRDKSAQAAEFARTDPLPDDPSGMDALFRRELDSGAYIALAAGLPMRLVLSFSNRADKKVVIRDLVVENKRDGPILDGTAIFIEAGAGPDLVSVVHLDAAYPVPRALNDEDEEIGAYFANTTISIEPGDAADLPIDLDARTASHAFTLAVVFDVDGKRYRENIDNHGQPFRVTPVICASEPATSGLTYQAVHEMNYLPPDDKPQLVPMDPRESASLC